MNKMAVGFGALAATGLLLVGGLAAVVSMQPDHIHLERQIVVEATAADMDPFAQDLKRVVSWSPWVDIDPDLTQEFSEETAGVGSWYAWEGNEEVGRGRQETLGIEPGKVVHKLTFYDPMESSAESTIAYTESGGSTTVVWSFDQSADFGAKAFTLFVDFEDMLGPDYERGLAKLKPMVEEAAKKRKMLAEVEAAKAEREAQAEAAPEQAVPKNQAQIDAERAAEAARKQAEFHRRRR